MKNAIAKQYIAYLSEGNMEGILSLFTKDGMVHSPIYGKQIASDFYKILFRDTNTSELKLKEIFEAKDSGNIALYFEYTWTVKSGKVVVFDVVDIITFNQNYKIEELKIIYDTVISRKLIEALNQ